MTLKEVMAGIESHEFAAKVNIANGFRPFWEIASGQDETRTLLTQYYRSKFQQYKPHRCSRAIEHNIDWRRRRRRGRKDCSCKLYAGNNVGEQLC